MKSKRYLGKKWTMIGLAFPFIAGWIIIIFANSAPLFYLGRLITGFSGLPSFPVVTNSVTDL
jgi:MFS family permease